MENQPIIPPQPSLPQDNFGARRSTVGLKALLILGLFVLVLGATVAFVATRNTDSGEDGATNNTQNKTSKPQAKSTIIYGYWTSDASIISAFDTSDGTNKILATLPSNIKHIKVVSPSTIMFIKNTDERDYGTEIVIRSLNASVDNSVFKADEGFGIDDYIVSPDGNYVAVWQVDPPDDSVKLRGGRSRVTTFAVSQPASKNVIYDEVSNTPVHYPVAVTNAGGVYLDSFLPNAEAGWAYGLSFSNFNGSVKEDIASMEHGTYSTQPVQSPDGNKLVFSGYDGANGSGTQVVNGFRRAIANPNTVEIYDLETKVRRKIASSENAIYPSAYWDPQSNYVMYNMISQNHDESGMYIYDLRSSASQKFTLPRSIAEGAEAAVYNVYASLPGGTILVADEAIEETAMGNLGTKYAPSVTAMYALTPSTGEKVKIGLNGEHVQIIGIEGSKYFPANIGTANNLTQKERQLQLQTFTIKPNLAPKRQEQQSSNRCRDVAAAQCNQLHGTSFTGDQARQRNTGNTEFDQCFQTQFSANKSAGTCSDSPLYLYGPEGLAVKVRAGTTIYSSNVPYSQEGFDIVLAKDGRFSANGKSVHSLEFDYNPAVKIAAPTKGFLVDSANVADAIMQIGRMLELNEKEIADTVAYAQEKATGESVFISLFDHLTSQKILPLYFDPVPDNYRNIVFYLENRQHPVNARYQLPDVKKITRGGFTAVEISFVVR